VLARGAAAEIAPGGENRVDRQAPARLFRPVIEEELAEPRALDPLEKLLGMIWSVSTSERSRSDTAPLIVLIGSMFG